LFFGLIQSLGDQGAGLFIEHSGFLLPRSVSRCRGAGWPGCSHAYPAYGWCIVLARPDGCCSGGGALWFGICRPGKRSATGRKGALFKQGVDVVLFVVQRRVQFFNLK
jgi:hypothetical protein